MITPLVIKLTGLCWLQCTSLLTRLLLKPVNWAMLLLVSQNQQHSWSGQLRQAVLPAVYNNLHSKSTRAGNVVISGLPKLDTKKDEGLVCKLIVNEFNLQPTVKHCRRIGKIVNNKPQNLLITLESVDHVRIILSNVSRRAVSYTCYRQSFSNRGHYIRSVGCQQAGVAELMVLTDSHPAETSQHAQALARAVIIIIIV